MANAKNKNKKNITKEAANKKKTGSINRKKNENLENNTSLDFEQYNDKTFEKNEMKKLLKIILIVTLIFAVFYVITIFATNKSTKTNTTSNDVAAEKAEIQYENIMIGTMLNHSGTYYVLIQNVDDTRENEYNSLIDMIKMNDDKTTIYKANLTDSFNKVYLAKEENYYTDDISEFAVKGTTLVKVVNGKVDAAFDNYDAIKNKLTELA